MTTFGSVCSGIEAASVAWEPLGWQAVWLSEIESFPCSVLAHRYPNVPNLGDMTKIAALIRAGKVSAPDVLVGGTPCQSFSIAGMRAGLADPRGQLTYSYVELANAIDSARAILGQSPCITVWENVPGVLSSKDNAFGCFLGALAGESCELQPAGGKWTDAGCVFGPQRAIAWRTLDAQYIGLAQRRKRVFVVSSAIHGFNPSEILFEFGGVRRDTPPSREARQETARDVGAGLGESGCEDNLVGMWWNGQDVADALTCTSDDQRMLDKGRFQAVVTFDRQSSGEYGVAPVASTMAARDYKSASDLVLAFHPTQDPISSENVSHAMGCGSSKGQASVAVAYGIPGNWIGRAPENGGNATEPHVDRSPCLTATDRHGVAYSFDSLSSNSMKSNNPHSGCRETDISKTLDTSIPEPSKNQGGIAILQPEPIGMLFSDEDVSRTITASIGKNGGLSSGAKDDPIQHGVFQHMAVRRLLPIECERLQGFPDGWTNVPHNGKTAADGPRYKALGNSMAVNVMAWIGRRIHGAL